MKLKTLISLLSGLALCSSAGEARPAPSLYQIFQSKSSKEKKIFEYLAAKGRCGEESDADGKRVMQCSAEFTQGGKRYNITAYLQNRRLEYQIKDIIKDDDKKAGWAIINITDNKADGLKKDDSVDVEVYQGLNLVSKNDWVNVLPPTAALVYNRNVDAVGNYFMGQLKKELELVIDACGLEQKVESEKTTAQKPLSAPAYESVLREKLSLARQEGYSRNFAENVLELDLRVLKLPKKEISGLRVKLEGYLTELYKK